MISAELRGQWLDALEARFGASAEIRKIQAPGKPVIHALYFADTPKPGLMTAVTCGLSDTSHPHWQQTSTRPELIITMNSPDLGWGLGAAWVASLFFDDKRFHHGDLFEIDDPISKEGSMSAFLLFAPSFPEATKPFTLPERTITLVGLYPIHSAEIDVYRAIGFEAFWKHPDLDLYAPKRPPVQRRQ